jgi:ABC-2 type transport system ATP-binding protein
VIACRGLSKFYGEVLGVNHVDLDLEPGITALVGPNGSGKSTLMNLLCGLLAPTRGSVEVLGRDPRLAPELFGDIGYATQYDAFPRGVSGLGFVTAYLRLHGYAAAAAERLAWEAIERVQLVDAARRKVAAYSKGMRQRIRLAQALAHRPRILVLDEPLNGLDPMARAELLALFRELATEGKLLVVSSHILHEVDVVADQVVLLNQGYLVAEGEIPEMRQEIRERPMQVMVRCPQPAELARRLFGHDHVVEVRLLADGGGLVVHTRDADRLYLLLGQLAAAGELTPQAVAPADDDALAVYQYLVGPGAEA